MKKPTKLLLAEHALVTYFEAPKEGTEFETVLKPEYWAHVAHQLRPGHKIEVLSEDSSYWALLMVMDAGKMAAVVTPLMYKVLEADGLETEDEDMYVKWSGPNAKFRVIRKADDAILKEGLTTKAAAVEWMKNRMLAA